MNSISWFSLASTVIAALAIAIGTIGPALAMGRAISHALDALARQPEAEKSITRTLFIGLAMIESLAIYCSGYRFNYFIQKSIIVLFFRSTRIK